MPSLRLRTLALLPVLVAPLATALLVASCVGDDPAIGGITTPPGDETGTDGATPGSDGATPGSEGGSDAADAAPPNPSWTLALTARTAINAVIVEPATGDVFVGGSVTGSAPELGIASTANGSADALLMKISGQTGKVVWAKAYGGDGDDEVDALTLNAGALFATGTTTGAAMAFTGANPGASLNFPASSFTGALATQSFIANIDSNGGGATWATSPDLAETAGSAHRSFCRGALVEAGVLYVLCTYTGANFGVAGNIAEPTSASGFGATVLRLSSLGTITGPIMSLGTTSGATVAQAFGASAGVVYVAGVTGGNLVNEVTNVSLFAGPGSVNGFVARFGTDGSAASATSFGSATAGSTVAPSALRVGGGHVAVTGKFTGSPTLPGLPALTSRGGSDVFVLSMPVALGSVDFAQGFGGALEDDGNDLALAADGATYAGGRYFSTDFTVTGVPALPPGSAGGFQGWTAKLDATTHAPRAASAILSSTGNVNVNSLQTDEARRYVVGAGSYSGLATFGPGVTSTSAHDLAGFVTRRPY